MMNASTGIELISLGDRCPPSTADSSRRLNSN
jgi:hypothetical protein